MLSTKLLLTIGIISLGIPLFNISSATTTTELPPPKLISTTQESLVATQPKRIALVIGNSNYQQDDEKLPNPVNDANDMAKNLEEIGFEVIKVVDADKKQMHTALDNFTHQLCQGCVGLFYYAGHGISVDGENYLIPIDARLEREKDVQKEAIQVSGDVQEAMEQAKTKINIIIIDACRNNNFRRSWHSRGSKTSGLSPMQTVSGTGTFIAFSTKPGETAQDGPGRNGTFTSSLLKYIKTPNITLYELFLRVGKDVISKTHNQQEPWINLSVSYDSDFYLNPVDKISTVVDNNPIPSPQPTKPPSPTPLASTYLKLRDLLAAQNWKDADIETEKVMVKVAGREKEGWLDLNACRNFPPGDLRTIDKLWLQYSNGRFGFSVQKKIWVDKGGKLDGSPDDYDTYVKLADEVGWRKGGNWLTYDQLTFNTNAPAGHLPVLGAVWPDLV